MNAARPDFPPEEQRAHIAFDARLRALARPGSVETLPKPAEEPLIEALLDRECHVHTADPLVLPPILRSGDLIAGPEHANHLFLGALQSAQILKAVRLVSDLYPDEGATLIQRVELGQSTLMRLSGLGIDGTTDLQVAGLPKGFWDLRPDLMRYPLGFELILIDGGRLVALPRSTTVEVL